MKKLLIVLMMMFWAPAVSAQDLEPATDDDGLGFDVFPTAKPKLSGKERQASNRTKAQVYEQARATVEDLFERLCPGRCELVELGVNMKTPRPVGDVSPGFETVAGPSFTAEPESISVSILLDSKLPRNFQSNMPRMIQHQLRGLAPKVNVRPELLNFPEPQLAPMPPFMPEPPQRTWENPPKPEQEEGVVIDPLLTEEAPAEPVEEAGFWSDVKEFLGAIAPWIGPILMVLVLFGMALVMLRKIGDLNRPSEGSDAAAARNRLEIDLDELRTELDRSRSLRNRVLRKWLQEDEEGLAELIRWIGPEVLSDLKGDSTLKPKLAAVSERVSLETEPLQEDEIRKIAASAKARLVSEKVVFDEQGAEWEFLEGIGVHNLHRIMGGTSVDEKVYVVGQLPASLRASYLDTLDGGQRRELVLGGGRDVLSKQDALTLASRLRRAADEVAHIGREADGQAGLVLEMVTALPLAEQIDMLRDLKVNRPELSDAVLARVCLESTMLYVPGEILADAIHRTPVETLASFMRGTLPEIRDHLLGIAPASKRAAVSAELSLEVPVGRAEFLDSRATVMGSLRSLLLRDGFDLGRANTRAMMENKLNPVEEATS